MAEPWVQDASGAVPSQDQQIKSVLLRILADGVGRVAALGEVEGQPLPLRTRHDFASLGEGLLRETVAPIEVGSALFDILGMWRRFEHREHDYLRRFVG